MISVPTKKNRKDAKEVRFIKDAVLKRISTADKLSRKIEERIDDSEVFGTLLDLDPGAEGYEDVIDLFIKLQKVTKDLVESYRKLKITEFDIRDKEQKISTMNMLLSSIDGKTPEQIREQIKKGKFAPINLALASLFGEAVSGDANAARSIMQGMNDWGSDENYDHELPELKVVLNLPEEEKKKYIEDGKDVPEFIDITPKKGEKSED